jgi:hypothetical protein
VFWNQTLQLLEMANSFYFQKLKLWVTARLCCCVEIRLHESQLQTPNGKVLENFFVEMQEDVICKWVCNAATTIAHILLAKVYKNYMISFKVRLVSRPTPAGPVRWR